MGKILILVNRDFVLYNFRIELVEQLLKNKYEVYISLPYGSRVDEMVNMGCHFIDTEIDRRGKNPFNDLKLLHMYKKIMKQIKPDVVLSYTTKCCIYGGISAGALCIPCFINVSGLGTAVEGSGVLQKITLAMYKKAIRYSDCIFFQNKENQQFFHNHYIYGCKERLIPGSGVNVDRFYLMEYPSEETVEFVFAARVIQEKGIEEYLKMAEVVRQKYSNTVFHILGPCDDIKYQAMLQEYEKRNIIRYHGQVQDTREYLAKAHCTVHPTYYPEGMSNVLLESEACGRPVITTNRSGCRETVEDGVTGFLIKPKDTQQLIDSVDSFMKMSNEQRKNMGLAARKKVEREFNREIVIETYMKEIENNII